MATRLFSIAVDAGNYISWFVTTQASFAVTVTLKDDVKQYFTKTKQSRNIEPPLALDAAVVAGSNLQMIVDIPSSTAILGTPHSNDILTDKGDIVGKEYTICLEDEKDQDYNDVAISIIAWKKKG
ncbi:hypothetical protein EZS27_022385 [termite gut metagenome]|uniref:Uncharacterized protein n=1 Tax=termite gut metagenome TaxID=433724 RepID=A0A5J4R522_9ZZZZ